MPLHQLRTCLCHFNVDVRLYLKISFARNWKSAACKQQQRGDQEYIVRRIIIGNAAHIHTDHDMAGINDSEREKDEKGE